MILLFFLGLEFWYNADNVFRLICICTLVLVYIMELLIFVKQLSDFRGVSPLWLWSPTFKHGWLTASITLNQFRQDWTTKRHSCFQPLSLTQSGSIALLEKVKLQTKQACKARLNDQMSFMLSAFEPNAVWINCWKKSNCKQSKASTEHVQCCHANALFLFPFFTLIS